MKNFLQLMLSVIRAVLGYCTSAKWSPVVQSLPAMQQRIVILTAKIKSIDDLIGQAKDNITGFTGMRKNMRNTLAVVSYTQLRAGMAFAKNVDEGLYNSLNYPLSVLKRMDFATIAQVMTQCHHNLAAVTPSKLVPFGITAATLQNWEDTITTYNDFISTPRNKVSDRKAAGEMLAEAIRDANNYVRTEIAPLAETFIETNTQFLAGFRSSLRRIPLGTLHNRLNAKVNDELGNPCIGCTVTVDEFTKNGRTYKAASAQTGINGTCTVSEFESGVRYVTISGNNIQTKQFGPFQFQNKKSLDQTFICTPAFQNLPADKQQKVTVS